MPSNNQYGKYVFTIDFVFPKLITKIDSHMGSQELKNSLNYSIPNLV